MGKIIKLLINLILISVLLVSGSLIYKKISDYKKADEVYDELREEETGKTVISPERLKSIYSDYKVWLEVENTNIDYPVVQTKDNEFYLKHDFNKDKSPSGTIFMDYRNDYDTDRNTIFYGHNMRNKTMFNQIQKFKDEKFFSENNLVKVHTNNGIDTYEVFSVYVTDSNTDYLDVEFENIMVFGEYINDVKEKSIYPYKGYVSADDKIITLSTCSYEFDDARTVIHAKLID